MPGIADLRLFLIQALSIVWSVEIQKRSNRNYTSRIYGGMAAVVVLLVVLDVDSFRDAGQLENVACVGPQIRIVDEPTQIAFEVPCIYCIKTYESREQPQVCFG